MQNGSLRGQSTKNRVLRALTAPAVGLGILALMSTAFADSDQAYNMAPPVQNAAAANTVNQDDVFQWTEVPQNQDVPIVRATFDEGGYQLYDNVGETIVVPFTNDNLYVMKFAVSPTGKMFFVNTGAAPTLYVPRNGYLVNATVPGAKWYPFTKSFHPETPVFVGIAPSWNLFIGMGWYPNMTCWGGYWGPTPFIAGGVFVPCSGFEIAIGGAFLFGWAAYHTYWWGHPAPFHVAYWNRGMYRWANRPIGPNHSFAGAHGAFASHLGGGGHHFRGGGMAFGGHGGGFGGGHGFGGGFGGGRGFGGFFHRR